MGVIFNLKTVRASVPIFKYSYSASQYHKLNLGAATVYFQNLEDESVLTVTALCGVVTNTINTDVINGVITGKPREFRRLDLKCSVSIYIPI